MQIKHIFRNLFLLLVDTLFRMVLRYINMINYRVRTRHGTTMSENVREVELYKIIISSPVMGESGLI